MLTRNQVIDKVNWYLETVASKPSWCHTEEWKAGYFCALKDNGLIDADDWNYLLCYGGWKTKKGQCPYSQKNKQTKGGKK